VCNIAWFSALSGWYTNSVYHGIFHLLHVQWSVIAALFPLDRRLECEFVPLKLIAPMTCSMTYLCMSKTTLLKISTSSLLRPSNFAGRISSTTVSKPPSRIPPIAVALPCSGLLQQGPIHHLFDGINMGFNTCI